MRWTLFFVWFSMGCAVRQYGTSTVNTYDSATGQGLSPVDFSSIEEKLEKLISAEVENVDRRDRLERAWELCQQFKTQRPASQHIVFRYLSNLVEIEQRVQDAGTDAVANPKEQTFTPISSIQAERLGPVAEAVPVTKAPKVGIVPPDRGAEAVMAAARTQMQDGDLEAALNQLSVCTGQPCAAATVTLHREVRDRLVYQEREAAGKRFQTARVEVDIAKRQQELNSIRDQLLQLQQRFPDSRYKDSVVASIQAVEAVIAEHKQ
ncbi:MAG: hypothetical protein CL930_08440 [Deltaproteobacteria bacterium]|nr:hypothetical protein [Deltaproteobacteria bacterium]